MPSSIASQLVAGGADAAQVRHRLDPELLLDPLGQLDRARPRRAAGAVGDRDEVRLERRSDSSASAQVALALVGLGREELEREDWLARPRRGSRRSARGAQRSNLDRVCQGCRGAVRSALEAEAPPAASRLRRRRPRSPSSPGPRPLEVAQVAERLGQQPRGVGRRSAARRRRSGAISTAVRGSSAERRRDGCEPLGDELAVALDVARDVDERLAVARQAQPRVRAPRPRRASRGTRPPGRASSRSRSTARSARADGRRRSAAGARAGTGRRATGRGRASRTPSRRRGRSRSRRRRPSGRSGSIDARDPGGHVA